MGHRTAVNLVKERYLKENMEPITGTLFCLTIRSRATKTAACRHSTLKSGAAPPTCDLCIFWVPARQRNMFPGARPVRRRLSTWAPRMSESENKCISIFMGIFVGRINFAPEKMLLPLTLKTPRIRYSEFPGGGRRLKPPSVRSSRRRAPQAAGSAVEPRKKTLLKREEHAPPVLFSNF